MADYKPSGTTTTTEPRKLTLKEKLKKRWWLHLINFAVGTIVITMLLNYVMLPKIAQRDVNKAELFMEEQIVSNPRPNAVHLKMRNKIVNHSLFTPMLDSFNASLFLEKTMPKIKPFGYITIPKVHALKLTHTDINQEMNITNMEQFTEYNKIVTGSKDFRVAIRGRTKLHLGALPVTSVNFNKAILMKGLNAFDGLRVQDVNITMDSFPDGSNMHGNLVLPNPSVMTLTIGDMVQDLYADGTQIGNATVKGVVLKPGDNIYPVVSFTDQSTIIPLIGPGKKFPTGVLEIEARTREISYEGHILPYFTDAMKVTPVRFKLDIGPSLKRLGLSSILEGTG